MNDVAFNAKVGVSGVINGGIALSCMQTGTFSKTSEIPLVNTYIPSGTLFTKYNTRFDEHYGGGPS